MYLAIHEEDKFPFSDLLAAGMYELHCPHSKTDVDICMHVCYA